MNAKGCLTLYFSILALSFILPIMFLLVSEFGYVFEYVDLSPWDYQKLIAVDADMTLVDEEGEGSKVVVTERLTFDVHQSSEDDLCYELWRDLIEQEVDGLRLDYTVLSVSQVMEDGSLKEFRECTDYEWDNYEVEELTGTWYHSQGPYSKISDRYEAVFFYVDGIYRDKVTFEITYEMHNVALKYDDCSDLYLTLYAESPIKDLEVYTAEIHIPEKDMPKQGNFEYYTYGTDKNGFNLIESYGFTVKPGYYTFIITLLPPDLEFSPYNLYLEFELVAFGEDKHIFTDNARNNDYTYYDALDEIRYDAAVEKNKPSSYMALKTVLLILLGIFSTVTLVKTFTTKKRMKAQHIFYEPTEEIDIYTGIPSDMDPNFAAALVFSKGKAPKDDAGIYSALLLSLARKDYVDITEYGADDAMLTLKNPLNGGDSIMPAEPLSESEILYYNLLSRHADNNQILMSTLQSRISRDYENTATFEDNIKKAITNIGVNGGYIQKADFTQLKDQLLKKAKTYKNLAIIFLIVVNLISFHTRMDLCFGGYFIYGFTCLICSIYLYATAKNYVLLTQAGANEYAKWKGLYNYLKSEGLVTDSNIATMPIWERYFIYATAFGIPTKVIKALGIKCPEVINGPVGYYNNYDSVFHNSYVRGGRIHTSSRRVGRAVRSGARFHRASATSRGYTGGGRSWSSYGGGGS
ncbi:MAG: DUF2207 domain-containing protein [Lachnospiraceae bacterium]|nr:DUF2207 domain-containing protein [Lachnospiraceae bacterium]